MLKLNKTLLVLSGSVIGLIAILLLSPSDWPANTHDRKVEIPLPAPRIGNLGGYPVSLPAGVVHLVEYDDSPGFDPEKIRRYNPPPRTYDSVIESFGYYVRYSTGEIKDSANYSTAQFAREENDPGQKWVSVGVDAGGRYRPIGHLNIDLKSEMTDYSDPSLNLFRYFDLSEKQFGLNVYAQMNIDPDTGRPFRETDFYSSQDLFVYKDDSGTVLTLIKCLNHAIGTKMCQHFFYPNRNIKINLFAQYPRQHLKDWRQIETAVRNSIETFKVP